MYNITDPGIWPNPSRLSNLFIEPISGARATADHKTRSGRAAEAPPPEPTMYIEFTTAKMVVRYTAPSQEMPILLNRGTFYDNVYI